MTAYALGHTIAELDRLALQGELLRPITERLLRNAGLRPGMSVLEIGCGAGDVCLLAAEVVGADGRVVGVDRSSAAVERASERARKAGLRNVHVLEGAASDAVPGSPFDFVIGRYVLVHQDDPVAFVRETVAALRPGGIAAFHEPDLDDVPKSRQPIPIYDAFSEEYDRLRSQKLAGNAAARLAAILAEAGLTPNGGFCERPVGMEGSDLFFKWRAATCAAFQGPEHPSAPAAIERIANELQAAVAAVHGQVLGPDQWCIWARR